MVFSSPTFLFGFLPLVLIAYLLSPPRLRNAVLFFASVGFYVWGSGALVSILLLSVVVDYGLGFPAARAAATADARLARLVVAASVVVNLGLLGYFKYAGWLIGTFDDLGLPVGAAPEVTLPIGISFFTFQSISYTIDVARGRSRHLSNPVDFGLYVTLFPQLIAGPIVRFHELEAQLSDRRFTITGMGEGATRFAHGLVKKVVVADSVAPAANIAFSLDPEAISSATAWVGIIAYSIQIYFDFSGYSDMAIGLGKMFGFSFPENFDRPYSAYSVTDFWRRWHITLSNWFRDYVYIPLGGSRMATPSGVSRNLLIVFFLTGLWHGANWTFVVWGFFHGLWLLWERRTGSRHLDAPTRWVGGLRRLRTLLIVMVGWVIFRAPDVSSALAYLRAMVTPRGVDLAWIDLALSSRSTIVLLLASLVFVAPRSIVTGPFLVERKGPFGDLARFATVGVLLPVALLLVSTGTASPFLYFQF